MTDTPSLTGDALLGLARQMADLIDAVRPGVSLNDMPIEDAIKSLSDEQISELVGLLRVTAVANTTLLARVTRGVDTFVLKAPPCWRPAPIRDW